MLLQFYLILIGGGESPVHVVRLLLEKEIEGVVGWAIVGHNIQQVMIFITEKWLHRS